MRPDERREQVLSIVRKREQATVEELAKATAASAETIRRDLTELAGKGLLRKVHGGAAVPEMIVFGSNGEGSFGARMRLNRQKKRSIA